MQKIAKKVIYSEIAFDNEIEDFGWQKDLSLESLGNIYEFTFWRKISLTSHKEGLIGL